MIHMTNAKTKDKAAAVVEQSANVAPETAASSSLVEAMAGHR